MMNSAEILKKYLVESLTTEGIIYTCSHCGKKLQPMLDYTDIPTYIICGIRADLCRNCYDELTNTVKDFLKIKT